MKAEAHKIGCMANLICVAYHPDGICPGPYGKCTCGLEHPRIVMEAGKLYRLHQPKTLLAVAEDIDRMVLEAMENKNLDDTLASLVRLHQQIISSILTDSNELDGKGESMFFEEGLPQEAEVATEAEVVAAPQVSEPEEVVETEAPTDEAVVTVPTNVADATENTDTKIVENSEVA